MEPELNAVPRHLRDDGVPEGTYSWGRNMDGQNSGNAQVLVKVNASPRPTRLNHRYRVVFEEPGLEEWQARAIAAILNAK